MLNKMIKNFIKLISVGVLFFVVSQICVASDSVDNQYEPTDIIGSVAKQFAMDQLKLEDGDQADVSVVSDKLPKYLAFCDVALQPSLPPNSSANDIHAVMLSCPQEAHAWQTVIPIHLKISTRILVAKNDIPTGKIISEDDLTSSYRERDSLYNGFYKDPQLAVGLIASRLIVVGNPITKNNTTFQTLVHRNQQVVLEVVAKSFMVTMSGVAQADGKLNDTIQVMNPQSKKMVDGIVSGQGRVRIYM